MDSVKRLPSIYDVLVLSHARDVEGRALYESKTPPDVDPPPPARLVPCDFADSPTRARSNRPMRQDAYEQVRLHFDEALWVIQALRDLFATSTGNQAHSLRDVRKVATLAQSLPRYLRAAHYFATPQCLEIAHLDGYRLPAPIAVVFKAIIGITSLIDHVLEHEATLLAQIERDGTSATSPEVVPTQPSRGVPQQPGERAWSSEDLAWVAETRGLLVGPREVCAAPSSMILRTLRTLVEGRPGSARPESMQPILARPEEFLRFAAAMSATLGESRRLRTKAQPALEVLERELAQHPIPLLAWSETKRLARKIERYFELERAYLAVVAERQAEVLALFGQSGRKDAPRLAPADVDARVFARNPRAVLAQRHPFVARYTRSGVTLTSREGASYELEL